MQTDSIVALLVAERDRLTRAIEVLQGPTKRRGRPPKNPLAVVQTPAAPAAGKRKPRSAAQKKAQSKRMKEIWAKKKTAEA